MVTHREIFLADGRRLHAHEAGDPDGPVVLYHHGTPSCGFLLDVWCADAEARGIRLLGIDRSGYGDSDPQPGRGLADVVADTLAVADWAGAERFYTWGVSGGGPHALACAALAPDRVIAAASVAGVAPYGLEGLDWTAGMGEENLEEFDKSLVGGEVLRAYLDELAGQIVDPPEGGGEDPLDSLMCPADTAFARTPAGEQVTGSMPLGLVRGGHGWYDDDVVFVTPWPFDVADITVPVLVTHGDQDRFVPISHAHWLAERIPGADTLLRPDEGHLSLYGLIPDVHAWLLDHA
ncbi:MAG: alpha/beta fold hydrolase [Nocardioides sp.]